MDSNGNGQAKQINNSKARSISFYIALSILGFLISLIAYSWVNGETAPPILSVIPATEVRQAQGQYYLPFTVENSGGSTAESVEVIAELTLPDNRQETGTQQIDFLSGGETESGGFCFQASSATRRVSCQNRQLQSSLKS